MNIAPGTRQFVEGMNPAQMVEVAREILMTAAHDAEAEDIEIIGLNIVIDELAMTEQIMGSMGFQA